MWQGYRCWSCSSSTALKGFQELEPAQGRLPMPFPVLALVVKELWKRHSEMGLWLLATPARRVSISAPSARCGSSDPTLPTLHCDIEQWGRQNLRSCIGPSKDFQGRRARQSSLDTPTLQGCSLMAHSKCRHRSAQLFTFDVIAAARVFSHLLDELDLTRHGLTCTYSATGQLQQMFFKAYGGSPPSRNGAMGVVSKERPALQCRAAEAWILKMFSNGATQPAKRRRRA
jgi:hypothetical protein